jgi:hypothetical protein
VLFVLEICLLSIFDQDFDLAASIIPQVHATAHLELGTASAAHTATVSHGNNGDSGTQGAPSSSPFGTIQASGNTSLNLRSQKHRRESDEPDESDDQPENRRSKRSKATVNKQPQTFACHFHKRNPAKYGPWTHQKYLPCIAPCVFALHRIK